MSESLVTKILSTGDISSEDFFARASEMPQAAAKDEKAMYLIRQGLEKTSLELAFGESTSPRGNG
jgi:hypothetical protein